MLNEKRVKHMVKLALYETKSGKDEMKVGSFYKRDYVIYQVLWSVVWMTIGYALLVLLLGVSFLNILVETFTWTAVILLCVLLVLLYVILLLTYIRQGRKFFNRKHVRAYNHVKEFKENLELLEEMYEKEDADGETL